MLWNKLPEIKMIVPLPNTEKRDSDFKSRPRNYTDVLVGTDGVSVFEFLDTYSPMDAQRRKENSKFVFSENIGEMFFFLERLPFTLTFDKTKRLPVLRLDYSTNKLIIFWKQYESISQFLLDRLNCVQISEFIKYCKSFKGSVVSFENIITCMFTEGTPSIGVHPDTVLRLQSDQKYAVGVHMMLLRELKPIEGHFELNRRSANLNCLHENVEYPFEYILGERNAWDDIDNINEDRITEINNYSTETDGLVSDLISNFGLPEGVLFDGNCFIMKAGNISVSFRLCDIFLHSVYTENESFYRVSFSDTDHNNSEYANQLGSLYIDYPHIMDFVRLLHQNRSMVLTYMRSRVAMVKKHHKAVDAITEHLTKKIGYYINSTTNGKQTKTLVIEIGNETGNFYLRFDKRRCGTIPCATMYQLQPNGTLLDVFPYGYDESEVTTNTIKRYTKLLLSRMQQTPKKKVGVGKVAQFLVEVLHIVKFKSVISINLVDVSEFNSAIIDPKVAEKLTKRFESKRLNQPGLFGQLFRYQTDFEQIDDARSLHHSMGTNLDHFVISMWYMHTTGLYDVLKLNRKGAELACYAVSGVVVFDFETRARMGAANRNMTDVAIKNKEPKPESYSISVGFDEFFTKTLSATQTHSFILDLNGNKQTIHDHRAFGFIAKTHRKHSDYRRDLWAYMEKRGKLKLFDDYKSVEDFVDIDRKYCPDNLYKSTYSAHIGDWIKFRLFDMIPEDLVSSRSELNPKILGNMLLRSCSDHEKALDLYYGIASANEYDLDIMYAYLSNNAHHVTFEDSYHRYLGSFGGGSEDGDYPIGWNLKMKKHNYECSLYRHVYTYIPVWDNRYLHKYMHDDELMFFIDRTKQFSEQRRDQESISYGGEKSEVTVAGPSPLIFYKKWDNGSKDWDQYRDLKEWKKVEYNTELIRDVLNNPNDYGKGKKKLNLLPINKVDVIKERAKRRKVSTLYKPEKC